MGSPLSVNEIMKKLEEAGVIVGRLTVKKHLEGLGDRVVSQSNKRGTLYERTTVSD